MRCGKCYGIRAPRGGSVSVPPAAIDFLGTLPDKAPIDTIFRPRRQRRGDSLRSKDQRLLTASFRRTVPFP